MLATSAAVFAEFNPPGIVAPIFLGGVIALLAFRAGQGHHWSDVFLHALLRNFGDDTGTDSQATLADGELGAFL